MDVTKLLLEPQDESVTSSEMIDWTSVFTDSHTDSSFLHLQIPQETDINSNHVGDDKIIAENITNNDTQIQKNEYTEIREDESSKNGRVNVSEPHVSMDSSPSTNHPSHLSSSLPPHNSSSSPSQSQIPKSPISSSRSSTSSCHHHRHRKHRHHHKHHRRHRHCHCSERPQIIHVANNVKCRFCSELMSPDHVNVHLAQKHGHLVTAITSIASKESLASERVSKTLTKLGLTDLSKVHAPGMKMTICTFCNFEIPLASLKNHLKSIHNWAFNDAVNNNHSNNLNNNHHNYNNITSNSNLPLSSRPKDVKIRKVIVVNPMPVTPNS